jgi:hypothetical protein
VAQHHNSQPLVAVFALDPAPNLLAPLLLTPLLAGG